MKRWNVLPADVCNPVDCPLGQVGGHEDEEEVQIRNGYRVSENELIHFGVVFDKLQLFAADAFRSSAIDS